MEDLNDKVTGNDLTATEWNQVPSELQNVIEALGQTLSNADLNQLGKGIAGYVANGNHYTDSGAADAYVLTQIGSKQVSIAYTDGMIVEFVPANTNAGSSTVNVASLGVKNVTDTSAGGEILSGVRISLRYNSGSGEFDIFQTSAAPVTAGSVFGLLLSNAADADHDITVATGEAADSTNTFLMVLSAAMTKQIDGAWVVGNNQPGLFSGTVAADTWYHFFAIRKTSDGTIDAGFDTSVTAANIPSGYTAYYLIESVLTDGSANILPFKMYDDRSIEFNAIQVDIIAINPGITAVTRTISTPLGRKVRGKFVLNVSNTDSSGTRTLLSSFNVSDEVPAAGIQSLGVVAAAASRTNEQAAIVEVITNSASQIRSRLHYSSANVTLLINTRGWGGLR